MKEGKEEEGQITKENEIKEKGANDLWKKKNIAPSKCLGNGAKG